MLDENISSYGDAPTHMNYLPYRPGFYSQGPVNDAGQPVGWGPNAYNEAGQITSVVSGGQVTLVKTGALLALGG